MVYDTLNTKQLTKKVEERKRFLERVVNFADNLLIKHGILIRNESGRYHTRTIKKLVGFEHFSFFADWGQTDMGGNDVKIWYHPHMKDIDFTRTRPVLHVSYGPASFNPNDHETEIKEFNEATEWQIAIEKVIKNKKKLLSKMAKVDKEKRGRKFVEQEDRLKKERANLEKDAERLGIKDSLSH